MKIDAYIEHLHKRLVAVVERDGLSIVPLSGIIKINHITLAHFIKGYQKQVNVNTIRKIEEYLEKNE